MNLLKQSIENLHIEHEKNDVSSFLTISIGAYYLEPNDNITLEEFYQKADDALYEAKQKRNSVVIKSITENLIDSPSLPPLQVEEVESV